MNITVRPYRADDWPQVSSWWHASGQPVPAQETMPPESSFIAEIEHEPALAVALYLTNTPAFAFVENFAGNPRLCGSDRREAGKVLADHISNFAKERGFKRLMGTTTHGPLVDRYLALGFQASLTGVTIVVRST